MIFKENPIEMQNSAYRLKCPVFILLFLSVIFYDKNPIENNEFV